MTKLTILTLTALLLISCGKTITSCPPLTTYTDEQEQQLAGEIKAAAPTAFWPRAMVDYHALRQQLRKCQP